MARKSVANFVLRYKWFFVAALVVLALLAVVPWVLKREGLPARARCAAGKVWSADKNKCVCAGSSEWDGGKCVTCSAGMVWDWGKKPRAGCACAPGTTWNGKWCAKPPVNAKRGNCPPIWGDSGAANKSVANGIKATDVDATYHYYAPGYETSSLQCGGFFEGKPDYGRKLLKYPWTAFCVNGISPATSGKCGKCFRVKNRRTGASTVVRAVDHGGGDCRTGSSGGLDMDPCGFNAIDTDGNGMANGHLRVDVEEVECGAGAEF
jgi:hypothetical protein